jgi:hypothetical protein
MYNSKLSFAEYMRPDNREFTVGDKVRLRPEVTEMSSVELKSGNRCTMDSGGGKKWKVFRDTSFILTSMSSTELWKTNISNSVPSYDFKLVEEWLEHVYE